MLIPDRRRVNETRHPAGDPGLSAVPGRDPSERRPAESRASGEDEVEVRPEDVEEVLRVPHGHRHRGAVLPNDEVSVLKNGAALGFRALGSEVQDVG